MPKRVVEDENGPPRGRDVAPATPEDGLALISRMLDECVAMDDHARAQGIATAPAIVKTLVGCLDTRAAGDPVDAEALGETHNALSELVKPATPGSILYLKQRREMPRVFRLLGPIPTIRDMVWATIISMVVFLVLGASDEINAKAMAGSFLDRVGKAEIIVSVFLLASAALGASFANLYTAYRYVIEGSYDPKYDTTYWIRFVLGIIAGYILAEILDLGFSESFSKPLLALLGGFSASAVFRILNKMVEAVEAMFRGDARAAVAGRETEIKGRLERQALEHKFDLANDIMAARGRLKAGGDTAAFDAELDKIIKKAIGSPGVGG